MSQTHAFNAGGADEGTDRRRHERRTVPAMYSSVEAKPLAGSAPAALGHVYDVSLGGVRIDLDEPLVPGTDVALVLHLPAEPQGIHVTGTVTRVFDPDDDPICRRAGIRFKDFDAPADESRLRRFLGASPGRLAA